MLVVTALVVAAGCGGGSGASAASPLIRQLPATAAPTRVLDLDVAREDMRSSLAKAPPTYAEAVGLFGLRDDAHLLQATVQLTRLNRHARLGDADFRAALVGQIGGSLPRRLQVGGRTVFVTRGTRQSLSVWFRGRYLVVLAVREDYARPRALVRAVLRWRP